MNKQVEFKGEIIIDDWQVIARYEHPEVFELTIFQKGEGRFRSIVRLKMTKEQLTDLRNLLKAIDFAEQIII